MITMACKNHPTLRWLVKEQGITDGKYNQSRSIHFQGEVDPKGNTIPLSMWKDECPCHPDELVVLGDAADPGLTPNE